MWQFSGIGASIFFGIPDFHGYAFKDFGVYSIKMCDRENKIRRN